MKRILLLGARGRLGAALARCWRESHDVTALSRAERDISDLSGLRAFLEETPYDILVNATGLTSLEACEENPALATRLNTEAVAVMAAVAADREKRLIHFSTDYVFDGKSPLLYKEDDATHPLSHYGLSKREGERAVLDRSARHQVFRVSWIFGPERASFVDMILTKALQGEPLAAIADKTSSPTYTDDIANWLLPFLEDPVPGGLYHACNAGGCSWHGLGTEALRIATELGWKLRTREIRPLKLAEMVNFQAPRPVHTVLETSKLAGLIGYAPRPWQDALRDYVGKQSLP